ncbi:helix-turn-helix domain-containing protein [Marinomonas arctica]|uniref:Helix-turn-helix domain-containing protein n=1 Tax=Marinomonas arctica TaxID=383750 RepID=A0A7H1JCF8_9GAMM|nr:helix-turn-helix domain-containing protein [Marinomonas arctica]
MKSSLVNREQAARYLGVSSQTLSLWACNGRYGLRYVKIGRRAMYRVSDLEDFLDRRTITHCGELKDE